MPEYLITKREKCPGTERTVGPVVRICEKCDGSGYIDTLVPLIDVLKMVRVKSPTHLENVARVISLEDAEIEE